MLERFRNVDICSEEIDVKMSGGGSVVQLDDFRDG
jgi:hypothetical protein